MGSNSLNRGYIGRKQFEENNGIPDSRNNYLNTVANYGTLQGISASYVLDFTKDRSEWLSGISFTRGTTASFLGSCGYITLAGVNEPRITYDRFGNTLGLIIEASWRNTLTWTEDFGNAAWTRTRLGPTAGFVDVALAPDGTTTADVINPDTQTGAHFIVRLSGIGGDIAFPTWVSAFYKKIGNTYGFVRVNTQFSTASPTDDCLFTLDLTTGNVSNVVIQKGGLTLSAPAMDPVIIIEPYPNDWWRASVIAKTIASNRQISITPLRGLTATGNEPGNSADGIYVWGSNWAMVSTPMQYRRNDAIGLNVLGDECSIHGSTFASWFRSNGSFYVEYYNKPDYFNISTRGTGTTNTITSNSPTVISTQYSNLRIMGLCNLGINGNHHLGLQTSTNSLVSTNGYTAYQALNKAAFSFSGTGSTYTLDFCLNGCVPQSMVVNDLRPERINMLTIGSCGLTTSNQFFSQYNGIIRKIEFYSPPLTKDQLRVLTSA